jgi:hypothetical protein
MANSVSEYRPNIHLFRGYSGDGISAWPAEFLYDFVGVVVDHLEWTVEATLRDVGTGAVVYTFAPTLSTSADGRLSVILPIIPGAVTAALEGEYRGAIRAIKGSGEALTLTILTLNVLPWNHR